ncbi:MAG: TlpA family protein disulfide reductase [Bacteroidetes bacterium]|nr:TlpA family protein disulfide reductase [Bacteroidota bacterium]
MKKCLIIFFFVPLFVFSQTVPKCWFSGSGVAWKGNLYLNDSVKLKFWFSFDKTKTNKQLLYIYNGEERITVNEVLEKNDSILIKMPLYDSEFKCKWQNKQEHRDSISGVWINNARKTKNIINFTANKIQYKTIAKCVDCKKFSGEWQTCFSPRTADSTKAIGIFTYTDCWDFLYGTFLTETGDYRYLCGSTNDSTMELSCFDGTHAFYFSGKLTKDGSIAGKFYSGLHWYETWEAKRNDTFELRNPDSLTFLKPGFEKINFTFKNLDGKQVSLSDEKYKNKVVIIQIMGTWCPNCMDETKYLSYFYEKHKLKGLEIIALAFEKDTSFAKGKSNCERLRKRFDVQYEILLTQKTGKDQARQALPMLNDIISFPTTIYIDKKGKVRKIHTGFNGPGTGKYFDKWAENNKHFIDKLLSE